MTVAHWNLTGAYISCCKQFRPRVMTTGEWAGGANTFFLSSWHSNLLIMQIGNGPPPSTGTLFNSRKYLHSDTSLALISCDAKSLGLESWFLVDRQQNMCEGASTFTLIMKFKSLEMQIGNASTSTGMLFNNRRYLHTGRWLALIFYDVESSSIQTWISNELKRIYSSIACTQRKTILLNLWKHLDYYWSVQSVSRQIPNVDQCECEVFFPLGDIFPFTVAPAYKYYVWHSSGWKINPVFFFFSLSQPLLTFHSSVVCLLLFFLVS